MKQPRFNPAVRISLAILIYFAAMFSFLAIVLACGAVDRLRTDYALLSMMNILVGLVLCSATMLAYRWLDRGNPFKLGFGIRKKDFGFILAAVVLSVLGACGFTWTMSLDASLGAVFHFEKLMDAQIVLLIALGCAGWLFGTLQEEVLDRGYFFANMSRMRVPAIFLVSNAIFALTHIPTRWFHPVELMIHFIGGIGYAYVYFKSGSLWLSTAVHGIHNLLLDLLFNNDYSVTLVTFGRQLTDADKLAQQSILIAAMLMLTYLFYGKNGALTPASNLKQLWRERQDRLEVVKQKSAA